MLTLSLNEKQYQIKFGYKPTVKSRILSKMAKMDVKEDSDGLSNVEEMLLLIPEILLVGLQKNHSDEFGYNYDTSDGKEEKMDLVFDIMENYLESEGADLIDLYSSLQDELLEESFLKSMFQKEKAKAKELEQKNKKKN